MEASISVGPPPREAAAQARLLRLGTDDQLVAQFRKGFEEAFETIDRRYRPQMLAYTRQMLGYGNADAEDAVQEVFIRASGSLRRDDRPVMLRPWLYKIAHNHCIDLMRRPVVPLGDLYDATHPPQLDPATAVEQREDVRRLLTDIDRLPAQQRSAILMQGRGLRNPEIAAALGISTRATKSVLSRARGNLKAAAEARETSCTDIRGELASAHGRKVRMSGRARKHLRDCTRCKAHKAELRQRGRTLNSLAGDPGILGGLAKLLGLGGAGSGAVAGGGAAAGGGVAATTVSVGVAPIAAKVTALICCAAVGAAGMGAAGQDTSTRAQDKAAAATKPASRSERKHAGASAGHADPRGVAQAAPVRVTVPAVRRARPGTPVNPAPTTSLPASSASPLTPRPGTVTTHRAAFGGLEPTNYRSPEDAAQQSGGSLAPDEDPATTADPPVSDQSTPNGAPADADSTAPPDANATAAPVVVHPKPQAPTEPTQPSPPPATGGAAAGTATPAPVTPAATTAPAGTAAASEGSQSAPAAP
jgi:RNA polymerase sigma factor (sigma-70 family)